MTICGPPAMVAAAAGIAALLLTDGWMRRMFDGAPLVLAVLLMIVMGRALAATTAFRDTRTMALGDFAKCAMMDLWI